MPNGIVIIDKPAGWTASHPLCWAAPREKEVWHA